MKIIIEELKDCYSVEITDYKYTEANYKLSGMVTVKNETELIDYIKYLRIPDKGK